MADLGPSMTPKISVRYPHMMPEDTLIWRKFVENSDGIPDEVWYDVRVGKAVEVPSGQPEWMVKFAEYSTRKRIDIVGRRGLLWMVIEAKPRAGVVALGQAVYYAWAFSQEYNPPGRVIPVIVTDVVDEDVQPVFDRAGVLVYAVGV